MSTCFRIVYMRCLLSVCLLIASMIAKADQFDNMRLRWRNLLTGGNFQADEPYIKIKIEGITNTALNYWKDGFNSGTGREFLWDDLNYSNSSHITTSYRRLAAMSLAYCTPGSALYQSNKLKQDIISALDWLNAKVYNTHVSLPDGSRPRYIDNWWDYKIGTPLELNNIAVLLYSELGEARIKKYMAAISHFTPDLIDHGFTNGQTIEFTAANRVWICTIIGVKAILIKDEKTLTYAKENISPVFKYVTSGDGFYADGSFIQHDRTPYSGGYGTSLLDNLSRLMYLLADSPWKIIDPGQKNIFAWIRNTFEPIVSPSGVMAMVAGREISRLRSATDMGMKKIADPLLLLSEIAPVHESRSLKSLLKNWFASYTSLDYRTYLGIFNYGIANKIVSDDALHFQAHFFYKQFPNMDRAVTHRPNYSFGISMHSTRTYNYESINNENIKGWHTGDGMTYLYNGDVGQFEGSFWPTVNFYGLPGTTVEEHTTLPPVKTGKQDWVGGTSIDGLYGITGMYLSPRDQSLEAKKSWFVFDNEIVALGAGIINQDHKNVQTFIEQRKLDVNNSNEFSINGNKVPLKNSASKGQSLNMAVKWAHLSGIVPGSDIGYYFPDTAQINILRQQQSGRWNGINTTITSDTTLKTNYFLTMWYNHGIHGVDNDKAPNKYAYVLLPGAGEQDVKNYNANPDVVVLVNSSAVQAVEEKKLKIIAANFWKDEPSTVCKITGDALITCNKKATVMIKETATDITISLADPTMNNNSTVEMVFKVKAGVLISKSPQLAITKSISGFKITANVKGLKGKTLTAKLAKNPIENH